MATTMNRVMVSIPPDLESEIEQLKQSQFYNKPYAELYRQIIRSGLDMMAESSAKNSGEKSM